MHPRLVHGPAAGAMLLGVLAVLAVLASLTVLAAACSGGGSAPPFQPGATAGGYTVLYDPRGLPPHATDGPCVQMVPDSAVKQAETGIGPVDCAGSRFGFNVQATPLDGKLIAVWGILPADAAAVTVAHTGATVKDGTYLALVPRPSGTFMVKAWSPSGRQVASLSSDQLPPVVPNVSS